MGVLTTIWDMTTAVIKVDDRLSEVSAVGKENQSRLQVLAERMVKVETTLEMSLFANTRGRRLGE